MCSIIMPADYEMLVSHSPPVFSHSPPTGFLGDYSVRFPDAFSRVPGASCRSPTRSLSFNTRHLHQQQHHLKMPASPMRPCLVKPLRTEDLPPSEEDPVSPTRLKKKVVFADDKGMSLTHVRVMTEPSNVPPVWSSRYLAQVTQGISAEPEAEREPWEISFSQPASDYVQFRHSLDTNKVSLENVIVKEAEESIIGTIKVSNLAFQKEVVVRLSSDNWKTNEDAFCKYVPISASNSVSAAYVLYDTFSFKLTIPPKARRMEFCVCFRCDGKEFWDNNGGRNYVLTKKMQHLSLQKSLSSDDLLKKPPQVSDPKKTEQSSKCGDALHAKVESWSEFASWTHLENNAPYW